MCAAIWNVEQQTVFGLNWLIVSHRSLGNIHITLQYLIKARWEVNRPLISFLLAGSFSHKDNDIWWGGRQEWKRLQTQQMVLAKQLTLFLGGTNRSYFPLICYLKQLAWRNISVTVGIIKFLTNAQVSPHYLNFMIPYPK